jgi:hypothetical protein
MNADRNIDLAAAALLKFVDGDDEAENDVLQHSMEAMVHRGGLIAGEYFKPTVARDVNNAVLEKACALYAERLATQFPGAEEIVAEDVSRVLRDALDMMAAKIPIKH